MSNNTAVETLAPTLWLTSTAFSNGATQMLTAREHFQQQKLEKLHEGGCSQKA